MIARVILSVVVACALLGAALTPGFLAEVVHHIRAHEGSGPALSLVVIVIGALTLRRGLRAPFRHFEADRRPGSGPRAGGRRAEGAPGKSSA